MNEPLRRPNRAGKVLYIHPRPNVTPPPKPGRDLRWALVLVATLLAGSIGFWLWVRTW